MLNNGDPQRIMAATSQGTITAYLLLPAKPVRSRLRYTFMGLPVEPMTAGSMTETEPDGLGKYKTEREDAPVMLKIPLGASVPVANAVVEEKVDSKRCTDRE